MYAVGAEIKDVQRAAGLEERPDIHTPKPSKKLEAAYSELLLAIRSIEARPHVRAPTRSTFIMQVVISLAVLGSALYVVVALKDAEISLKDWAYGAIGTIVGFWLKG